MNSFMQLAILEAELGMRKGEGGPFGAVIVCKGKVLAKAHNEVLKAQDPTAHAEIQAIRKASAKLKRFDLSDCELYTTCEPCPMCLGAVHWAKMKKLYYGCTQKDAAKIGFDDQFIYDVIRGKAKKKQVLTKQCDHRACLIPFQCWERKENKVRY